MTIDRRGERTDLVISPRRIYGKNRQQAICDGLKTLVNKGSIDLQTHVSVPYHQYLHGQRVLFSFLLAGSTPGAIIAAFNWIATVAIALTLGALAWRAATSGKPANLSDIPGRTLVWATLMLQIALFLFFYDLRTGAYSFFRFPTDLLIVGFVIASIWIDFASLKREVRIAVFAVFGALIAYFELLHGAIPLAAAVIAVIIFVQSSSIRSFRNTLHLAIESLIAFGASIAACFAFKIVLVTILVDAQYPWRFVDLLVFRMGGDARTEIIPELAGHFPETDASIRRLFWTLRRSVEMFGFGSRFIGLTVFAAAIAGHVLGTFKLFRTTDQSIRSMLLGLMFSSSLIWLWFLVFREHTIEHSWMSMLLAWPIGAGGAMILLTFCDLSKSRRPLEIGEKGAVRPMRTSL